MGKQRETVLKITGHAAKDEGVILSVCNGGYAPLWGRGCCDIRRDLPWKKRINCQ